MPAHKHTSPGWYPEPDILPGAGGILRYWDGQGWTDRRRPRPILTALDLVCIDGTHPHPMAMEGPVRTLAPPAPTAEITAAREAPAAHTTAGDQQSDDDSPGIEHPASPGRGWDGPPEPPRGYGGGGGGDSADDGKAAEPATAARRRRKWWLLCGIAVLAAIAVGLAGQAMRPGSPGPRVLTDANFVRLANKDCYATLPTLRPPDGGPLGSSVTALQAADQIDTAADGMDALISRLALIPAADVDRPHITGWLDGWHGFATTGHEYATFLRQHGTNQNKPPAMLDTAARLARAADRFAQANGLTNCHLAFVYTASPSDF